MSTPPPTILSVATTVRAACERAQRDYLDGEVDTDAIFDLPGFCLLASEAIREALEERCICAQLIGGLYDLMGHYWVEAWCGRTWIVDVTITQFDSTLPKVVVLDAGAAEARLWQAIARGPDAIARAGDGVTFWPTDMPPRWWAAEMERRAP